MQMTAQYVKRLCSTAPHRNRDRQRTRVRSSLAGEIETRAEQFEIAAVQCLDDRFGLAGS